MKDTILQLYIIDTTNFDEEVVCAENGEDAISIYEEHNDSKPLLNLRIKLVPFLFEMALLKDKIKPDVSEEWVKMTKVAKAKSFSISEILS